MKNKKLISIALALVFSAVFADAHVSASSMPKDAWIVLPQAGGKIAAWDEQTTRQFIDMQEGIVPTPTCSTQISQEAPIQEAPIVVDKQESAKQCGAERVYTISMPENAGIILPPVGQEFAAWPSQMTAQAREQYGVKWLPDFQVAQEGSPETVIKTSLFASGVAAAAKCATNMKKSVQNTPRLLSENVKHIAQSATNTAKHNALSAAINPKKGLSVFFQAALGSIVGEYVYHKYHATQPQAEPAQTKVAQIQTSTQAPAPQNNRPRITIVDIKIGYGAVALALCYAGYKWYLHYQDKKQQEKKKKELADQLNAAQKTVEPAAQPVAAKPAVKKPSQRAVRMVVGKRVVARA